MNTRPADPRRLNVALTRAKYGMVVLGTPRVLARQGVWNALLWHFKEAGCLVEGEASGRGRAGWREHRPG